MAIDTAAWYEKYGPMVIRRCRSLLGNDDEAMDAMQDVFLNLLRAQKRLRPAFPSSLLYTMATNVCLNRLRTKKRELPWDFFSGGEEFSPAVDDGSGQVDAKLIAQAIMEDESEKTQSICFMYHADGMTLSEIGEAVGMSVSGVRKRLRTFRKRARLKLGLP
jgi:RNA polymerase sigma-70 factor (ECF subfamily)